MPHEPSQDGASLVEVVVAGTLLVALLGMVGACLLSLASVLGRATDEEATFLRAASALVRVEETLASAVQSPGGVTATPTFTVSASSVTFRAPLRVLRRADADRAALAAAGRVSSAGIVYEAFARTIYFDPQARELRLRATGTRPAGMPEEEVLCRDVSEFAFFDGESRAAPPGPPRADGWVLGARIVVSRASTSPEARGATIDSSVGAVALTSRFALFPETLLNKRSKPVVGSP